MNSERICRKSTQRQRSKNCRSKTNLDRVQAALVRNPLVAVHYPAGLAISWQNDMHIVGFLSFGHDDFFSGQAFNKLILTGLSPFSTSTVS
jgi:predicted nucleotidyltransferase